MDSALEKHLADMLADSLRLEEDEEPAQSFDKIARGVESLLSAHQGGSQAARWRAYFADGAADNALWLEYERDPASPFRLAEELGYYVGPLNREAAERLREHGRTFQTAVNSRDRTAAGEALANFANLLRNKRFHGDPAFSGHNFRVLVALKPVLRLLRAHLQRSASVAMRKA